MQDAVPSTVLGILATLRSSPILPRPASEVWSQLMSRISLPGETADITQDNYDYFLNVLPPHWMGQGFMFAEGAEPFRYFWQANGRHYCRQMTWNETADFCRAARIPVPC